MRPGKKQRQRALPGARPNHSVGDQPRGAGHREARQDGEQDGAQPHQLVAVQQDEDREERGDRGEPQQPPHYMTFNDTIHSSPARFDPRYPVA